MIPPVMVPIRADIRGFRGALTPTNTGLKRIEMTTKRISQNLFLAGQNLRRAGWASLASLTVPIALVGRTAVKSFGDFDKAMTNSLAIATKADRELRETAENLAKTLSTKLAYSATQLGEGYYYLISSGMDLKQSMKSLRPAAMFARAGLMNMAEAVEMLTDTQSALGLSFQDPEMNMRSMVSIGDNIVYAAKRANAEVLQFTQTFTNKAAAMGRAFGQSMNDMLATMMAFANRGEKGMRLGMRISMLLRGLSFAAERSKESFKKYGIALYDTAGKMRPMHSILGDLETLLSRYSEAQIPGVLLDLGFTERSLSSLMTIRGASQEIKQHKEDLDKKAGGSLHDVASYQMKGFEATIDNLKNSINNMMIDIGKRLRPFVLNFWKTVSKVVSAINSLSDAGLSKIIKIAAALAAIGPSLLFLGGLQMVAGVAVAAIGKIIVAVGALVGLFSTLNTKILVIASSLKTTLIGFAALIKYASFFALTLLTMGFQWAKTMTSIIFGFQLFAAKIVFTNALLAASGAVMLSIKTIALGLGGIFGKALGILVLYGPLVASLVIKFRKWKEEGKKTGDVVKDMVPKITGFMYNITDNIAEVFNQMEGQWGTLWENMFRIAIAAANKIATGFPKIMWTGLTEYNASLRDLSRLKYLEIQISRYQKKVSDRKQNREAGLVPTTAYEQERAKKEEKLLKKYSKEYANRIKEHNDRIDNVGKRLVDSVEDWNVKGLKPITFDKSKLKLSMPNLGKLGGVDPVEGLPGIGNWTEGTGTGMPGTGAPGKPGYKEPSKATWASFGSKEWYTSLLGGKQDEQSKQTNLLHDIAVNTAEYLQQQKKPDWQSDKWSKAFGLYEKIQTLQKQIKGPVYDPEQLNKLRGLWGAFSEIKIDMGAFMEAWRQHRESYPDRLSQMYTDAEDIFNVGGNVGRNTVLRDDLKRNKVDFWDLNPITKAQNKKTEDLVKEELDVLKIIDGRIKEHFQKTETSEQKPGTNAVSIL